MAAQTIQDTSSLQAYRQGFPMRDQTIVAPITEPIDPTQLDRNLEPLAKGLNINDRVMSEMAARYKILAVDDYSFEGVMINGYFMKTIQDDFKYYGNNRPIINNIWSISRNKDEEEYRSLGYDKMGSTLLWHGTSAVNVHPILDQGFRTPTNRGLFGPALYFADRAIKSLPYTRVIPGITSLPYGLRNIGNTGHFFLCQVATGNMLELSDPQQFDDPPECFDSIKALGIYQPDPSDVAFLNGSAVPWGEAIKHETKTNVRYNEYMVYSTKRILIKYLIQFTWHTTG